MLIRRVSEFSGIVRELEIDVTVEQIHQWRCGMLIQDAMPHLSADDREYLITGMTPEEWDGLFPTGEEE